MIKELPSPLVRRKFRIPKRESSSFCISSMIIGLFTVIVVAAIATICYYPAVYGTVDAFSTAFDNLNTFAVVSEDVINAIA